MNKKKVTIILIGVLLVIVSVFFINNSNNGIFKNIDMTNSVDEGDDNLTDFQKENKEKEKEIHQKAVSEKIEQLDNDKGLYSTDSIVLSDTTKEDAEHIAEEIGAEVRMTKKGDFAVLYLPKDVSIEDIYDNDKYASYIPQMTPDYYVSTNLINGNGMDEEDVIPDADMVVRNHPNYSINDPAYTNQQYIDYINLKDTWEETRGAGITVAIIDSGIDTDHAEFIGKISEKSYNASEDKIVKDYDISVIEDENGHGTAVAGVLAASMNNSEGITGISPDVNLVVIKCDVDDTGKFVRGSDLVFGLAYAIESDVDIINMSFGSPIDIFSRYTELAVDSDIICIAAAGNDGSNMPVYPASLDSVIAVGAYDTENGGLTEYSNYGDNVNLLAPGTAYTTYIDGGYKMSTGTSISAPIVSGAAALYIASNGKTQFDEMRQLFEASSHDLGDPGQDYRHGFGELDVYALVCEEKGTITYDMLTDEVENAKGHTEERDEAVAPTSTKKGLTEGSHCSVCGEVLVAQKEIPMLSGVPFTIDVSRINDEEYVNSLAVNVDDVVIPTVEISNNDDKIIINLLDEEHEYTVIGDNQNAIIETGNVKKIITDNISLDSIQITFDDEDNAKSFELVVSGNNNIKNISSTGKIDIIIKSDETDDDMNDEVVSKLTMAPQEGVSISTNGKLEITGVNINITSVDTAIYADDIVIDSADMKIELTGHNDVKSIIAAENSITIKSGNVNTVKPEGSKAFDFEVLSPSGKITLLTGATVSDKASYSVEPIIESNAGQNDNGNDKNKTADDKEKVEDKYPVDGKQVQDESREKDFSDSVPPNSDTTKDQKESNNISVGDTITYKSAKYKVLADGKVEYVSLNNKKIKSVVIPDTISDGNGNKYKITGIADNAFKNYKKLTKVTIGKNITKIGKNAFYGCKKLSKITIKSSLLKSVGKNAIKGINKKAVIKVPKKKLSKYKKLFKNKTGYKKTMKIYKK